MLAICNCSGNGIIGSTSSAEQAGTNRRLRRMPMIETLIA